MKEAETFTATIYVGLRVRYTGVVFGLDVIRDWLQSYCKEKGFCVTVSPTEYIYTHGPASGCVGREPGCAVGLINYPRFPSDAGALRQHAISIGRGLLELCQQGKVSIVFPDTTVMLEPEDVGGDANDV